MTKETRKTRWDNSINKIREGLQELQDVKEEFEEVFNISLENFYKSLKNYTNDIYSVLPSESLKLENIFSG